MRFSPKSIDDITSIIPTKDPQIDATLQSYQQQKEEIERFIRARHLVLKDHWEIPFILDPLQINAISPIFRERSGIYFLHLLIKKSYDAGHNDFIVNTANSIPNDLFSRLCGKDSVPLKITAHGDVGNNLAFHSQHLVVTAQGNTKNNAGSYSKHCSLTIYGNHENQLGSFAHHLTVRVLGNNGFDLGKSSSYSNITINGDNGHNLGVFSTNLSVHIKGNTEHHMGHYSNNLKAIIDGNMGEIKSPNEGIITNANIILNGKTKQMNSFSSPGSVFLVKLPETYAKLKATGADVRMIK
jgi:hypothetical protein